jgi:hypothetical protein
MYALITIQSPVVRLDKGLFLFSTACVLCVRCGMCMLLVSLQFGKYLLIFTIGEFPQHFLFNRNTPAYLHTLIHVVH